MDLSTLPIIDTHQHLWDLDKLRLPWLENGNSPLARNFLMSDYRRATQNLNVVQTVYMEVDVAADQVEQEAQRVLEHCRSDDDPMTAAVLGGDPSTESFADYAREYGKLTEVKGFRKVLHSEAARPGRCLQPAFVRSMRLLGELGCRFDLCMRPAELDDGAELAKRCPDTQFVVDHCGNMPVRNRKAELRKKWESGIRALAERENTVCKISGIVASAGEGWEAADLRSIVEFCIATFGEDRVFFGGDWPVCTRAATFAEWAAALFQITQGRGAAFQRKLFAENARRFYELPESAKMWTRP